jgi:undecaprenyl diphosphate synthase
MTSLLKNFEKVVEPNSEEGQIISSLEVDRIPTHVAIIMDGNGRWASKRGLPRVEGHRAGIESVKNAVEYSARLEIPNLTLYAFSAENWKRPADEVNTLWSLLRTYLRREISTLQKYNIRFKAIGRLSELPDKVRSELERTQQKTNQNDRMNLVIALNYSGRLEIVDAFNQLLLEKRKETVSAEDISERLYTAGIPDPDLMIRTSGEMRISNFLLWQIAYSEIYVSDVLWPDFRGIHFLHAIEAYQKRERRYGGILTPSLQNSR